jgi:hypothetical protein
MPRKRLGLNLLAKYKLLRNTRRNENVARHRGQSMSGVRSYSARVRNATRKLRNQRPESSVAKVVEIQFTRSTTILKNLNTQLKLALKLYKSNYSSNSNPVIDAISALLVTVTGYMEETVNGIDAPDFLDFLELELDSDDPYKYVKELTRYIDKNIINYKGDVTLRLTRAEIIIGLLTEAINDNAQQLNEAISNNKSPLAQVVGGIVEMGKMNVNNNL